MGFMLVIRISYVFKRQTKEVLDGLKKTNILDDCTLSLRSNEPTNLADISGIYKFTTLHYKGKADRWVVLLRWLSTTDLMVANSSLSYHILDLDASLFYHQAISQCRSRGFNLLTVPSKEVLQHIAMNIFPGAIPAYRMYYVDGNQATKVN